MMPEDFASIFPELWFVALNSFSSKRTDFLYHIYIPTDRPMLRSQYADIVQHLISRIETSGFPLQKNEDENADKANGIDRSKVDPWSLFYLPCQPQDPSGACRKQFVGGGREALAVNDRLQSIESQRQPTETKPPPIERSLDNIRLEEKEVSGAIDIWRQSTSTKGQGNQEFYRLAVRLAKAGVPGEEIDAFFIIKPRLRGRRQNVSHRFHQ